MVTTSLLLLFVVFCFSLLLIFLSFDLLFSLNYERAHWMSFSFFFLSVSIFCYDAGPFIQSSSYWYFLYCGMFRCPEYIWICVCSFSVDFSVNGYGLVCFLFISEFYVSSADQVICEFLCVSAFNFYKMSSTYFFPEGGSVQLCGCCVIWGFFLVSSRGFSRASLFFCRVFHCGKASRRSVCVVSVYTRYCSKSLS